MEKMQPFPGRLRTSRVPPLAWTPWRLMASPRPRRVRSVLRRSNGRKSCSGDPRGQPAALVLDLDANLVRGRHGPEEDTAMGTAELERVAEEIRNGGREEQAVGVHGDLGRHCP